MKKKVFWQNHWLYNVLISFLILVEIGCFYLFVYAIFSSEPMIGSFPSAYVLIISLLAFFVLGYEIKNWVRDRIILEQNRIYVPETKNKTVAKVQYEVSMNYVDIDGLFIVETQKDSLNRNDCSALPIPYIAIDCKDGEQKLISIQWYSKKRKKAIIDEIILRARNLGNDFTKETGEEIYNAFIAERKREYREMKEKLKKQKENRRKKK